MSTWGQLIEDARRDISDADRCAALGITPATQQLHRRLRQVTQAMEELLSDNEAVERAARALGKLGWTDGWCEPGDYDTCDDCRRALTQAARTALTAAIEGEQ